MSDQTFAIHVTPDDRAAQMYLSVPFECSGHDSVEVAMSYDDSAGARIDIGCESPLGWRGWSGGARRRFVIGAREATWGYVPGELESGEWNIVLGLHVVPPPGVTVHLRITSPGGRVLPDPESEPPIRRERLGRPDLPAPAGMRWYACDFHAHTLHSDGSQSIGQVARRATAAGLDAIAITDHNTVSHHAHLAAESARHGITLIPGQEITTARGHANAFGAIGWVDFRRHPREWSHVTRDGGILSLNHPVSGDCSWQWPLDVPPTHAEIFHSSWLARRDDTSIWSWWNAWGDAVPLGGSDFHYPESGLRPGSPTTWVAAAEPSVDALLDGVRTGRVSLAAAPSGPVLLHLGDEMLAQDADGLVLHDMEGRQRVIHGERVVLPAIPERRYHLETPGRRIMAITGKAAGAIND